MSDTAADKQYSLEKIEALLAKLPESPWFFSHDDAEDCPSHSNSGLALVDTGRESDWPIARLCHWPVAEYIAASVSIISQLLERVKASDEAVEAERDRCCRAICSFCRDTDHYEPAAFIEGSKRLWHRDADGVASTCAAAAIRSGRKQ